MAYIAPFNRDDFRRCIHCGLCLEACPTYRLTFEEGLSARGRIDLIHALAQARIPPAGENPRSLDLCLVCGSCEAACPSGVRALALFLKARSWLPAARSERREKRVLRWLRVFFLHPRVLNLALRAIRSAARSGTADFVIRRFFAAPRRRHFLDLIASMAPRDPRADPIGARRRPRAPRSIRGRAGSVRIFRGCVTPVFFPNVLVSLESLLARCGTECETPAGQVCCGALLYHHGEIEGARRLARQNLEAFSDDDESPILAEAAGCGAMLKGYGTLLADDSDYAERAQRLSARVQDATEFLAQRLLPSVDAREPGAASDGSASAIRIAYQDPCHLRHVQSVSSPPRRLLDHLDGFVRVEVQDADLCCGSAGIYNLLEPAMSEQLAEAKLETFINRDVRMVVTANPGCRLQLAGRLRRAGIEMRHVIEICADHWPDDGGVP